MSFSSIPADQWQVLPLLWRCWPSPFALRVGYFVADFTISGEVDHRSFFSVFNSAPPLFFSFLISTWLRPHRYPAWHQMRQR